jgi:hypothetical protein
LSVCEKNVLKFEKDDASAFFKRSNFVFKKILWTLTKKLLGKDEMAWLDSVEYLRV